MRKWKKTVAWILGLVLLLSWSAAAGEKPEIPEFGDMLNVRSIDSREEAREYAREFWALDYVGMDMTGAVYEVMDWGDDLWHVLTQTADGYLELAFDWDGNVTYMENIASGWTEIAPGLEEGIGIEEPEEDEDAAAEWRHTLDWMVEYPFLAIVNPVVYGEYTDLYPPEELYNDHLAHYNGTWVEGEKEFDLYYSEYYRDESFRIKIGVQTRPVLRIVFFDVFCDVTEGGNG